jgi:hypothetical protein
MEVFQYDNWKLKIIGYRIDSCRLLGFYSRLVVFSQLDYPAVVKPFRVWYAISSMTNRSESEAVSIM